MGDPADAELAVALVLPAAPLGEDQPKLVSLLGDFKGGVCEEVLRLRGDGKGGGEQEDHRRKEGGG